MIILRRQARVQHKENSKHARLIADGYERASTIGFRCVADSTSQCGGLCGQVDLDCSSNSTATSVDLTTAGSEDWLAFAGNQMVRKLVAGRSHRLLGLKDNASHTPLTVPQGLSLSWSDGDSIKSAQNERSAVATTSESGFTFSVRASAQLSVLTLFLGGANSAVNVSATLSDGSAPTWDAPLFLGPVAAEAGLEPVSAALRFTFSSTTPGASLAVRWKRSVSICDRCHALMTCLCAASGEQTPAVTGIANLTAEASKGGNWVTMQSSPRVKNLPMIITKANASGADLIPLQLAFVSNGSISANASAFGAWAVRVYGTGSPLGVVWSDGPSSYPRGAGGAGVGLSSGVFVDMIGQGFVLTAGSSAEDVRQLTLYGGCDGTTCRMEASFLSGDDDSRGSAAASAAPVVIRKVISTGGSIPFKFMLAYKGHGMLMVRYFCAAEDNDGVCNLTFQVHGAVFINFVLVTHNQRTPLTLFLCSSVPLCLSGRLSSSQPQRQHDPAWSGAGSSGVSFGGRNVTLTHNAMKS
jgi:hypothetical protein